MITTVTFNPAVDQTVRVPGPLESDVVNRSESASFDAGGKGINVSQYLDALGVETVASGFLGGFTGSFIRESLTASGVESAFVSVPGTTRVNTTILAEDGEYKVNQRGARADQAAVESLLLDLAGRDPDVVAVCGSLPPGIDAAAVDAVAAGDDWTTAVDVGGELLAALEETYGSCKPNREELGTATGMPVGTVEECVAAARSLRDRGFERVVASLGPDGALLVTGDRALHAAAMDVDVVDTVGAGDALFAGVLGALDGGASEERALRTGVAVATRVVGIAGTAVPDLSDVEALADAVDVRSV